MDPQGFNAVKNSMGLLQGPRLMAWTTKSPIRGNHWWVPLGCRALLGSVKIVNLVGISQKKNCLENILQFSCNT